MFRKATAVTSPPTSPVLAATAPGSVVRSPTSTLYDAPGSVEFVLDPECNTAALGLALDPADVLTDRTRGWTDFVRALKHHFDRLADAEKAMAKSHSANAKQWNHPSQIRNLSFDENSAIKAISDVFHGDAVMMASQHDNVAKSVDKQTVAALDAIKKKLKQKVATLEKEQKERNRERVKDKEMIVKAKEHLTKAISFARRPGTDSKKHGDPWLANLEVKQKLAQAKLKHAARNQKIVDIKADYQVFEANLIRELKVALIGALASFDAEKEWEQFCVARLNKSGGPAMFETDEYEGFDDPLIGIVHEGLLSRKSKGPFNSYKEHYYVVTAGGFLHEFKSRPQLERTDVVVPDDTIYLGNCTLDALSVQDRKPEQFILTEKNEDGNIFHRASHVYKFLGSSMAVSEQFHAALSSMAKATMGVVATGSTNATLGRSSTTVTHATSQNDEESETLKRTATVS